MAKIDYETTGGGGIKGFLDKANKPFYFGCLFIEDWGLWSAKTSARFVFVIAATSIVVLMPLIFKLVRERQESSDHNSVPWDVAYKGTEAGGHGMIPSNFMHNKTEAGVLGWVSPDIVYGLVHMAKTGGSSINGELALNFERVCGNKGYSYDAFAHNERMKSVTEKGKKTTHANVDTVSKLYHEYNRGRVPHHFMAEIGYEDCDYIASEQKFQFWEQFSSRWKMELHVPCREPLDHLMSQCNRKGKKFICNAKEINHEVSKCAMHFDRFSMKLQKYNNITLRCFDPLPPSRYVDYMGNILQNKRIDSKYIYRATNKPRNKNKECIWKQSNEFQYLVRQFLIEKYDFYRYCNSCTGSKDELML